MIKLLRGDTLSENFLRTLGKLLKAPVFDAKTAYRVKKIKDAIFKEREATIALYDAFGEKYATKDEAGKPVRLPDTSWNLEPEKEAEATKEWESILMQEVQIAQHPLEVAYLEKVQFSALEIETLSPVLSGLDEEIPAPTPLTAVSSR